MPFTRTFRNQPSRIICAVPGSSFRSVLLRIALSELCMCRVSTTITGCSIAFSSRQPDADRRRLDADPDDPFMVRQHRANGVGIGRHLGFAEPLALSFPEPNILPVRRSFQSTLQETKTARQGQRYQIVGTRGA